MTQEEIKSQITKEIFWDINFNEIDFEKQKSFIIPRVMDRGTKRDVKLIWNFYGELAIKENLLKSRYLEDKTIYFFANLFSIEPQSFRAFHFKKNNSSPSWNL